MSFIENMIFSQFIPFFYFSKLDINKRIKAQSINFLRPQAQKDESRNLMINDNSPDLNV